MTKSTNALFPTLRHIAAVATIAGLAACSVMPPADYVDIEQLMGPWCVIAHIPPDKTENALNTQLLAHFG